MSEIKTKVTAETAEATSKINRFVGTLKGIGVAAKGIGAGVTLALGPIAAISAALGGLMVVSNGFRDAIDYGGDLEDLSTKTGIAIDSLVILEDAFEKAGLGADTVGKAVLGLSNKLETPTKTTKAALDQLGISLSDIVDMSAEDRFKVIGDAIAKVSNQAEQASIASKLFGKSLGPDLLVLFSGGSAAIKDAERNVGGLANTMQQYAPSFAKIGDAIESVIDKSRQFFAAVIGENADRLVEIANAFMGIDLTKAGETLGQMLDFVIQINQKLIEAFNKGEFFKTLGYALELAWLNVKPVILDTMTEAGQIFSDILIGVYNNTFGQKFGKAKTRAEYEQEAANISDADVKKRKKEYSKEANTLIDMVRKRESMGTGPQAFPYNVAGADVSLEKEIKKQKIKVAEAWLAANVKDLPKMLDGVGKYTPSIEEMFRKLELKRLLELKEKPETKKEKEEKKPEKRTIKPVPLSETPLGPDINLFTDYLNKQMSGLMEKLFGDRTQLPTTSMQKIGGASALTGARSALDEAKETNNILRQIKALMPNKKPNNTTVASFA